MRYARWLLVVTLVGASIVATSAAQSVSQCPGPAISTKDNLVAALDSMARATGGAETRAAFIAGMGEAVVKWSLDLAGDSSSANPPARRAAALRVLRFARYRPAVPTLVRLAEPLRGDWVVWQGAINALTWYPYPELEPFWIEMLQFPRRLVRDEALVGIALVGTPQMIPAIRGSVHKDLDAATLALAARAETSVRLTLGERIRRLDSAVSSRTSALRDACSGNPRSR